MSDEITYVRCIECGNEQPDMGRGVACEECGCGELEPVEPEANETAEANKAIQQRAIVSDRRGVR